MAANDKLGIHLQGRNRRSRPQDALLVLIGIAEFNTRGLVAHLGGEIQDGAAGPGPGGLRGWPGVRREAIGEFTKGNAQPTLPSKWPLPKGAIQQVLVGW